MKFSVHKNKVIFFVIFIAVVFYIFTEKPINRLAGQNNTGKMVMI